MRNIKIRASRGNPFVLVDFKNGIVELSGEATSNNIAQHLFPIFQSLNINSFATSNIEVRFFLSEVNVFGNREIIKLLKSLKQKRAYGIAINCHWFYEGATGGELGIHLGELLGLSMRTEWLPGVDEPEYGF